MTKRIDALVIGAGVAGLTTAVCLAEQGVGVKVVASRPPEKTTSAVAGAIIGGPLIASEAEAAAKFTPVETTTAWHKVSMAEFTALAERPGTGVRLAHGRLVNRNGDGGQEWAERLPDYRACTERESAGYPVAFWTTTPIVDMTTYLPYLAARAVEAGAVLEAGEFGSLAEAAALAPVVLNCAGTGAGALADDPDAFPVRGQHVVVENPGLDDFFFEQNPGPDFTGYFAHGRRLVLGGNARRGSWDLGPDAGQTEDIIARCVAVEPRIADCRILGIEVGLRSSRPEPRVAAQTVAGSRVVHNYGHGGIAVGLSWGSAREAVALALADGPASEER